MNIIDSDNAWIGLKDITNTNTFEWIDGNVLYHQIVNIGLKSTK